MSWSPAVLPLPLLFCIGPLLARGWRSLAAIAAVGALALGWVWFEVLGSLDESGDDHGMAAALAVGFALLSTVGLVSGAAARTLGLTLQARGRSRLAVLWSDLLAVAVPAGLLAWFVWFG